MSVEVEASQLWFLAACFFVPMALLLWWQIIGERKSEEKGTKRIKEQSDRMLEQMNKNVAARNADSKRSTE